MNTIQLLQATSRAFYLSLRILPSGARQTMSLAYLMARCADSIADGDWLPPSERLPALETFLCCLREPWPAHLESWKNQIATVDPAQGPEPALLHHFAQALRELEQLPKADQALVIGIVSTLTQGMKVDLQRFSEAPSILASCWDEPELRQHLWAAAGCVGEFWTAVLRLHEPRLKDAPTRLESIGTQLGSALQLTNVLRDLGCDLAQGRCYLPAQQLLEVGLKPTDLLDPQNEAKVRPLFQRWLEVAYQDFSASQQYIVLLPWQCWRLRLSALWPWAIGVATLTKLHQGGWLRPQKIKVSRAQVYRTIVTTSALAWYTPWLEDWMNRQLGQLRRALLGGN